ncbi:MAG: response regulator [Mogibacterium sp.]|nr:response regulator [Mogibacterium sp.]
MFGKHFELDEKAMTLVETIGSYMPGGFFIYKAEGNEELMYANKAVFDIYGCDGLEDFKKLTGYTFKGMVHPDDYAEITESIDDQIEESDENIDHVVYRIIRKDGEVRWVDDYGHYDESERLGGLYYVFISDITEKHLAEEQAQVAMEATKKENLRLMDQIQSAAGLADLMGSVASLLSNMPAMSFSKEVSTGRYLACNQAFAEYAGKSSPDEVVGFTDHDLFDKETADHFVKDDTKAVSMDEPYVFFEDVPDATGKTTRNLQTTKLKFTDNTGRLCTLGMCVDVTEIARMKESEARQKEMEERIALQERLLEEQEQRKRQDSMIIALSSDYRSVYYVDLDEDEGVCYLAAGIYDDDPLIGQRFPFLKVFTEFGNEHVHESYREGYMDFIKPENIRRELLKHPIITYRFLEVNGDQEKYSMLRMAGVRHLEDRPDGLVHAAGIGFTDIDEEMRESMMQQKALAEALDVAEQANVAKTAFLSNMSHEIRTPMNAIIGLDRLALNNDRLEDETREYLEKIGESARHLLGLINDILDMSRIESGRLVLRKEEFSFSGMLEQINTMVMSQCNEKGLKYECKLSGGVGDYYIGDDMKLKQVLINMLSNAIKFTEAPGSIMFEVERVGTFEDQSTLKFVIRDTGIGIDKEFIPKIFDSFTQENSSHSSKYGSTGLGMAITKNIVELMNGTISVRSEKGEGTEFTVVISLKNCDRPLSANTYIKPQDMKVLVVDDEEIAAEHARIVLDEAGISADTCFSGEEALRMIELEHTKHTPYNLILLDWKMPDMDGIKTAAEIRKRYDRETTVIILTSFNWDEIMDEAMHVGVDSFLAKPLFASNVIDEFARVALKNGMDHVAEKRRVDLNGRHILMAEDIKVNAEIMKRILEVKGIDVDHAENGKITLDTFAASDAGYYDAILMDVRMPEMDGLEASAAIRALDRPDAKTVPIIALTANAFDEDVQRSLQVGMNAHLSKPVDPDHLYSTLEELIWEAENR